MSMLLFGERPEQRIMINNQDVTSFCRMSSLTKRENALPDLEIQLVFEDREAENVSFPIGSIVTIEYRNLDYNQNWVKEYEGQLINIEYSLTQLGEIYTLYTLSRNGRALKNMRVLAEFGSESENANLPITNVRDIVTHYLNQNVSKVGFGPDTDYYVPHGYVFGVDDNIDIPYVLFPYQDAFMSTQDLIKLANSARYKEAITNLERWRGLHWIINRNGYMCLAPVGYHNVQGDYGLIIENEWNTYALNGATLVCGEDTIEQTFTEDEPLANIVVVAGKYVYPKEELFTEGQASEWQGYVKKGSNPIYKAYPSPLNTDGAIYIWDSDIGVTRGKYSLGITAVLASGLFNDWEWNGDIWDWLGKQLNTASMPAFFYHDINIDFFSLITRQSPLTVNFSIETQGGIPRVFLLFMKDTDNFFAKAFTIDNKDVIQNVSLDIKLEDMLKESGSTWDMAGDLEWNEVKYIGFSFRIDFLHSGIVVPQYRSLYIDNLNFTGNLIRMASNAELWLPNGNFNPDYKYGVKMMVVKDSLATTDSLVAEEDDNPLGYTALGYLLMNGYKTYRGKITFPLIAEIEAGQLIKVSYPKMTKFPNDLGKDYKTFRIVEANHTIDLDKSLGAITTIKVVDDVRNSIVRGDDEYSNIIRAVNPDFQTKTFASLFATAEWDIHSPRLGKKYVLPVMNPV